jgi:acylphosphatase
VDNDTARLTAVVRGRVQAVFFRYSARRNAAGLGLTGTVRNITDGSVESVAERPRGGLGEMLAWLREGPPEARVEDVEVLWGPTTSEFSSFEVRR